MPSYGIGAKKKKKEKVTPSGYTKGQVKAQEKASNVTAIGMVGKRRKAIDEILGK